MTNLHVEWEVKDEGQATATTWAPQRKAFWHHASGRPWQRRVILCTLLLALFAGSMQVAHLVDRAERTSQRLSMR